MVVKPDFCSVCRQIMKKKDISQQTLYLIINQKKIRYARWVCAKCSKSRWVTNDGLVLREGEKQS